jgi:uncharacterized membrane protein YhdT
MRRGARWLLLLAIAAILGSVVVAYRAKKREMRALAPRHDFLGRQLVAYPDGG